MLINSDNYFQLLECIKEQIRSARYKAALGLNREQISLYWKALMAIAITLVAKNV